MFTRYCFKLRILRVPVVHQLREISNSEMATALRPFYFAVHPDLFGRHPEQRKVNEESLKHLSAHLEALAQRRFSHGAPKELKFYIRNSEATRDSFKVIKVKFNQGVEDPKAIIKNLLELCSLSTDYIKGIKTQTTYSTDRSSTASSSYESGIKYGDINYGTEFNNFESMYRKEKNAEKKTLLSWLRTNVDLAHLRSENLKELKEEVAKLQKSVTFQLSLKEVRYDCGWNYEHYRGCLKTLERLAKMHEKNMDVLKGRIVVFAAFTGVSLEGHVMLFTGDVLNNWLDFIKNIPKHDSFLMKIPSYEYALSQVLKNIKIGRRKFMPKQQAVDYAGHLNKVTTTLGDYLSRNKYPKSWPKRLDEYELVIESESGPLMVSPTGQLIAPATCPGFMLVDFLTNHMEEAKEKSTQYKLQKHIEKKLHKRCIDELHLKSLTKDDSVTPDKMIQTLEKLLVLNYGDFHNIYLNVTNYYSVLTDGTVCIPWDFKPE